MKENAMTYDEWEGKFRPRKNHLDNNASHGGTMFETYGPELKYVREADPLKVWTLLEGDDEKMYVVDGFHLVNRLGYFVTHVARKDEDESYSILDD